ncbi:hypothetical protein QTN25_007816 [Entamoeba marina]
MENEANKNIKEYYNLGKYEVLPEGDDEDVILQCETMYDQLEKEVINKMKYIGNLNEQIQQIAEMIEVINKLTSKNYWNSLINKEMENANLLIESLNLLVDNVYEKQINIHNVLKNSTTINREKLIESEERIQDTLNSKKQYYNFEQQQQIEKMDLLIKCNDEKKYKIIFESKINVNYKSIHDQKIVYDSKGHDKEGFDKNGYNKDGYDSNGYDKFGYDKFGYDKYGYDFTGYDKFGYDGNGYDKDGYDKDGYNKDGYDENGYNRYGYDKLGYDRNGYNENGYNRYGYDKLGYDRNGYNENGYYKDGYDDNGYNINGYNRKGYNKDGYDKSGYDKDGYDRNGYDRNGYDRNGILGDGCRGGYGRLHNRRYW